MRTLLALLGAVFAVAPAHHESAAAERIPVCASLVLAIDASGSTQNDERHFEVQVAGHAAAFRDATVHNMIEGCTFEMIAVAAFTWSDRLGGDSGYRYCMPWRMLASAEDAIRFADDLESSCGVFGRILKGTDVSIAITRGRLLLHEADQLYETRRRIIDVSGNGRSANGSGTRGLGRARALADEENVTVNSIVLDPEDTCGPRQGEAQSGGPATLYEYFRDRVSVGPLAFTVCAESPESYAEVLLHKVRLEIAEQGPERTSG